MEANTKEQLLAYFKTLDVATLEKLQKYSKLLIIPDEDLLVNATMSQMVEKAHSLADTLFPEWTDRSKSDFGEFLVELFALFSEKDFWYINAFANEGILRKMRSYSNAFAKASSLGYTPYTCTGASAKFNVTFVAGETTTYQRGDLVIDVDGLHFTNDEAFTVPNAASEVTLTLVLHEGKQIADDIVFNGYNVFIRKTGIDIDSIALAVDNVQYSRVKTFGLSSKDSTHFMVVPEEDGSCIIYFGNNGFGVSPAIGKNIRVEYRTCKGAAGNHDSDTCSIGEYLNKRKVVSAVMLTSATKGTDAESLTSIKERAPLFFSTKKAAINEKIAQDILNSFSFVNKAKVKVNGREVVYSVIPNSGYPEPTLSELEILREEFVPYLMVGYNGVYSKNLYRNFMSAANIYASKIIIELLVLSGYDKDIIEGQVRQIFSDLTNPLVEADYGKGFSKADTDIRIRSRVPGVQNVVFKMLASGKEDILPDISISEMEIFNTINQDKIEVRINVV